MRTKEDQLILEAADWSRSLRNAPTQATYDAFDAWVRQSPAHLRCFMEQSSLDEVLIRSGFAAQHTVEEWVLLQRAESPDLPL